MHGKFTGKRAGSASGPGTSFRTRGKKIPDRGIEFRRPLDVRNMPGGGELHLDEAKTGPRAVQLAPTAVALLEALPRRKDGSWVFPGNDRNGRYSGGGLDHPTSRREDHECPCRSGSAHTWNRKNYRPDNQAA